MARLFVAASSTTVEHTAALVSALPLTFSAWVYPVSTAGMQFLGVYKAVDASGRCLSLTLSSALRPVGEVRQDSGAAVQTASSPVLSLNTWNHVAVVFSGTSGSSTLIACYTNGTDKQTTATTFTTPTGLDRTTMGCLRRTSPTSFANGRLAEPAIWNVALNDAEVLALSKGVSPLKIQPAALVSYPPLWGLHSPEIDLVKSGATWTLSGTPPAQANHAPVRQFTRRERASFPYLEFPFPQTVTPTAAAMVLASVSAALSAGAVTLSVAPAALSLAAMAASLTPGAVTLTPSAAATALSAVTATLTGGQVTLTLTPAQLLLLAQTAALSVGAVTLNATPANLLLAAITAELVRAGPAIQYRLRVVDVNEYDLRVES